MRTMRVILATVILAVLAGTTACGSSTPPESSDQSVKQHESFDHETTTNETDSDAAKALEQFVEDAKQDKKLVTTKFDTVDPVEVMWVSTDTEQNRVIIRLSAEDWARQADQGILPPAREAGGIGLYTSVELADEVAFNIVPEEEVRAIISADMETLKKELKPAAFAEREGWEKKNFYFIGEGPLAHRMTGSSK